MTLLFVGGLFGLALLAVIGAVVLSMPDRRAAAAAAAAAAPEAAPNPAAQVVATARPTVPLNAYTQVSQPLPSQVSQTLQFSQTLPATPSQPLMATPSQHLASLADEETMQFSQYDHYDALSGQIRELSSQLHVLHQQTQELSQRLKALTETADHIETQNGRAAADPSVYSFSEPVDTTRI